MRSQKTQLDVDMARLSDGDRNAFAAVFRALSPILVSFCKRFLTNAADADDAAQAALEKIFRSASEYDPDRPALPWAFTIAMWECATFRKTRQRSRTQALDETVPSSSPSPEDHALNKDLLLALEHIMQELTPADQSTINQAFFSEAIGPASPAFRKRKARALSLLRRLWRRSLEP